MQHKLSGRCNSYLYGGDDEGACSVTVAWEHSLEQKLVTILYDPMEIGGFAPGTKMNKAEMRAMLSDGCFTLGTLLVVCGVRYAVCDNTNLDKNIQVLVLVEEL